MSINKTRSFLYTLARLLGDFQALSSGSPKKIAKRVARRAVGKATGKAHPALGLYSPTLVTKTLTSAYNLQCFALAG